MFRSSISFRAANQGDAANRRETRLKADGVSVNVRQTEGTDECAQTEWDLHCLSKEEN